MDFFTIVVLLVILMTPIAMAPVMQSLLKDFSPKERRKILIREMFFTLLILLCFMIFGDVLMKFLQLDQATLNLSGGVLLFIVALGMVFPMLSVMKSEPESDHKRKTEPFIVPIAVPLVAGPAAMATVLLYAAKATGFHDRLVLGGAILCACLIATGVILASQRLFHFLGDRVAVALERLMGMLLILLSIQMFVNGLHSYGA